MCPTQPRSLRKGLGSEALWRNDEHDRWSPWLADKRSKTQREGAIATALPMGALRRRKQAERGNQGASDAVSVAIEHPASAMRRRRDGQQRRPQSENLLKTLGSNCIQEGEPSLVQTVQMLLSSRIKKPV